MMSLDLVARSWNEAGLTLDCREWLNRQYHQEHRHYHDIGHVWDLLFKIERYADVTGHDELLAPLYRIAWFHDADYWVRPGIDEANSAEQMRIWLQYTDDHPEVLAVRDTAGHTDPSSELSAFFIDLDLSRIGAEDYNQFILDSEKIRAEYRHATDHQWLKGRMDFLANLANRGPVFLTEWGNYYWEDNAQRNIEMAVNYYAQRLLEL